LIKIVNIIKNFFTPKPEKSWWCQHRTPYECHATNTRRAGIYRATVIGISLGTEWPTCIDSSRELLLYFNGECTPLCDNEHTLDERLCENGRELERQRDKND